MVSNSRSENICLIVEVMVVSQVAASGGVPNSQCMGIVVLGDVFPRELAVEFLLWRELGLCKLIQGVHILIWVGDFPQQKTLVFSIVLCTPISGCNLEDLRLLDCHQLFERCQQ